MLDEKCIITEWIVQSLASRGLFDGCGIYRAEPPGETNDDGHPGTRKGCACKSPITKILVWWIKAVQCTYPLLFFAASSFQGQGLLSFITWLVLDCLYHLVFVSSSPDWGWGGQVCVAAGRAILMWAPREQRAAFGT